VGQTSAESRNDGPNRIWKMGNENQLDGLYIRAQVYNQDVTCLIDTGSTITVLHPNRYFAIPEAERPALDASNSWLRMADGGLVSPLGTTVLTFHINGKMLRQRMVIAEVEAPIVLGYDFMHEYDCHINITGGILTIEGQPMQCERESQMPSVFRVQVSETVEIPASSEMLMRAELDGETAGFTAGLIEPIGQHADKNGVLIARAVVDPSRECVLLRAVNLTGQSQIVYKGTHVATCERIERPIDLPAEATPDVVGRVNKMASTTLGTSLGVPTHLEGLYDSCKDNLTVEQQQIFREFLVQHQSVFAKTKEDLGQTNVVKHKIHTGTAVPVKQPPRRVPIAKQDEAAQEVKRMLQSGIIEPSKSPWASPVVLVKKKDGSLRYCIDYRRLNHVTIKDSYPLPRIDDSLDSLRGAKWLSTCDLASGYWQVEMDPDDAEKTAFTTSSGLFQFKVMPFGLCNAPATFERLMECVLAGLQWEICLVYLDDIIVFADTFEEHVARLGQVLTKVHEAGLKVSAKKCHFFQEKVAFLGHIVSPEGVATDPAKVEAVDKWPQPRNVHHVRSFLGTCSYYRRFIKGFAGIAKPLHKLTEKQSDFLWTAECQTAFEQLKEHLTTAPILAYPSTTSSFLLDTDASGFGIGAVMSQEQEGTERVIAYFSRTLIRPERNYCVTRRELLAIVEAVKHFHHHLYGRHFTVRTDHGALNWLLRFKNQEGQMARWLEVLAAYDFQIIHRAGKQHGNADGLSSRPCFPCDYCTRQEQKDVDPVDECECQPPVTETVRRVSANQIPSDFSSPEDSELACNWLQQKTQEGLRVLQHTDPVLRAFSELKEHGERPEWKDISAHGLTLKSYWAQWENLHLREGVLYRRWLNPGASPDTWQLLVPHSLQKEILEMLHQQPGAGHLGITRTFARVQARFYWVGYRNSVMQWCQQCQECQARKGPPRAPRGGMQQYIVGAPMERIALDILGPLPESNRGHKYILIIADYFTRWTEAYPMPNQEAVTVARLLMEEFVCRFGVPRQVHSDQGRQFESGVFQELCRLLRIDKTRTTPYHPQSDGLVERFNKTVEDMLSKYISTDQRDWDEQLPHIMLAYRSSVHESTGQTPSSMMLGREVTLPIDLLYGQPPVETEPTPANKSVYIQSLTETLWEVHEHARENMLEASNRQKKRYDHRAKQTQYKVRDVVWLRNKTRVRGKTPKLQNRWDGPFVVTRVISDLVYQIQSSPRARVKTVHHDNLKPYYGEFQPWLPAEPTQEDVEIEPVTDVLANEEEPAPESMPNDLADEASVDGARPKRAIKAPRRYIEEY
jgi:transposase InsO family protein